MDSPNKQKNTIIISLLVSIIALAFFSFKKSQDYSELQLVFADEKHDLKENLDEMIKDYTDVVIRKKKLSKRLRVELNKMKILRDSIKILKLDDYTLIRKYRRRIAHLERENRNLFIRIDSLNDANQALTQENVIANEILQQKETINLNLEKKYKQLEVRKKDLEKRIATVEIVKTSPIRAIAMKERSSGKLTRTTRSSRTDAFKINFDLLENPLARSGEKPVFIQIVNESKNIVSPKGRVVLKNGDRIQYTDSLEVNYIKDKMSLVSFILVDRKEIKKGKYTVSAFVDGVYSGNTIVKLR